jgi:hypothetical protein
MAEIVIGPKSEMEWDKAKKDQILAATGSWVYRERARDKALEWRDTHVREALKKLAPRIASFMNSLEAIGYQATTPVHRQLGTMRHNEGQTIGVESNRAWGGEKAPVYHSLRIDVDDDKGPHYNVMVSTATDTLKACFRFDAPPGKDPKEWVAKIQAKWSR